MTSKLQSSSCDEKYDSEKYTPKLLPCGHTVCQQCVPSILKLYLACSYEQSKSSVEEKTPYYALMPRDEDKYQDSTPKQPKCEEPAWKPKCKKHNEEAPLVCLTCSEYICCRTSDCLANHHSTTHKIITLHELIEESK